MPWINKRWIAFFSASTAILVLVISILGWRNYVDGVKKLDPKIGFGVDLNNPDNSYTKWTSAPYALKASLVIDSFDPGKAGNTLGFHFEFTPLNQLYSSNHSDVDIAPTLPVRLILGSATVDFPANTVMADRPVSQVTSGDVNWYPFDKFYVRYYMGAFTSGSDPLPLTVFLFGAVQGFSVDAWFLGLTDDGSQLWADIYVTRSGTSKVFAIIIFLVMWCLSVSIFLAAMSVWFRGKKVELPVIAISTALLFALPNVRNSQPGIPSVAGTTSDMVGFFWNLILVAISAVSLLVKYILQNKRERPMPPPIDAESLGIRSEVTPMSPGFPQEK
jgi:hypothetical protein